MAPNNEQIKSLTRSVLTYVGGVVTGWLAGQNLLTPEQLLQVGAFFTSEALLALIVPLLATAWGIFVHSKTNAVTVVDAMPEVAGVVVHATIDGKALAESVATPTVAPEGTVQAAIIAQKVK